MSGRAIDRAAARVTPRGLRAWKYTPGTTPAELACTSRIDQLMASLAEKAPTLARPVKAPHLISNCCTSGR